MTIHLTNMLKRLIRLAKRLPAPEMFLVNAPNGYKSGLPDNLLLFARGGRSLPDHGDIHHRYLLNLNLGSPCRLILDGKAFLLDSGSCFLIYPYENHMFMHTEEDIFRMMITFESEMTDILPERQYSYPLNSDTAAAAEDLLSAYLRTDAERWDLTLLLSLLLSKIRQQGTAGILLKNKGDVPPLTASVVKYITGNLERDLSLKALAERFHISGSTLRRRFPEDTGSTLGEYIEKSRISKAMLYLSGKELTVGEIAERCGYSSVQSFSRAFRREARTSPIEYRKMRMFRFSSGKNHVGMV